MQEGYLRQGAPILRRSGIFLAMVGPVATRTGASDTAKLMNIEQTQGWAEPDVSLSSDRVTRWFALNVTARHEKVVSQLLQNKGCETFLPLYTRRHRYERRFREFELPLFPGYVFCRSDLATRLPILTTPGVIRMVGAGRIPIPVDDDEIRALKSVAEAGVSMYPLSRWQPGQLGRIIDGPLTGIEGIVVREKQSLRLVLSVSLLQRSVFLEIDSACVVLAQSALTAGHHR